MNLVGDLMMKTNKTSGASSSGARVDCSLSLTFPARLQQWHQLTEILWRPAGQRCCCNIHQRSNILPKDTSFFNIEPFSRGVLYLHTACVICSVKIYVLRFRPNSFLGVFLPVFFWRTWHMRVFLLRDIVRTWMYFVLAAAAAAARTFSMQLLETPPAATC